MLPKISPLKQKSIHNIFTVGETVMVVRCLVSISTLFSPGFDLNSTWTHILLSIGVHANILSSQVCYIYNAQYHLSAYNTLDKWITHILVQNANAYTLPCMYSTCMCWSTEHIQDTHLMKSSYFKVAPGNLAHYRLQKAKKLTVKVMALVKLLLN